MFGMVSQEFNAEDVMRCKCPWGTRFKMDGAKPLTEAEKKKQEEAKKLKEAAEKK